jgi:hypothetical protein
VTIAFARVSSGLGFPAGAESLKSGRITEATVFIGYPVGRAPVNSRLGVPHHLKAEKQPAQGTPHR